ncbi:hypothetical protein NA8A_11008 [Nitratireductor indicus C115]|uniref:DUF1468 domain-containing protein n=1 Tax=Nitratireductor indicus C115 TaxID=1231190 RepID=K2PNH3_9HYPH|nr:tripartite tricarboxylate transporter TctB family protein [Nitratireductor indicus]EKF42587.1 hypothetical protein NA8A_11008 [Nitratireductor indicus C115]SFQ57630.1 Tripartite tricarboxylate transporter TctB family protein [Nitratireductor indicus]
MKRVLRNPGNLLVVLGCAAATIAYVLDAQARSRSIENLAFIVPLAVAVLALCLLVLFTQQEPAENAKTKGAEKPRGGAANAALPYYCFGAFVAYVLSIPHLGFDVANMIFVALFVWLQSRRQPLRALLFGLVFGLGAAWVFQTILPYRLPMTLL